VYETFDVNRVAVPAAGFAVTPAARAQDEPAHHVRGTIEKASAKEPDRSGRSGNQESAFDGSHVVVFPGSGSGSAAAPAIIVGEGVVPPM
jgi:hypothetical protein